ncbi:hypothetical protein HPU229254_06095 [Helicobacter pullorum]|nr:hypothetical protein HPU229254_06095 [Helicobacter pullorum]
MKKPSTKLLKITFFLSFFIGAFILLYTFLYNGIRIHQFQIAGIQFQEFYLRLDKKLILEIQSLNLSNLEYSTSSSNMDIQSQIQYAKNIHLLLQYFQKIQIHQIILDDYNASLNYDGDNFTINLPWLYTKLNLIEKSSQVLITIHDFYLKEMGIYYRGEGKYNLKKQNLEMNGRIDFLDIKDYKILTSLHLQMNGNSENIYLKGSSNTFENINFLRPLLPPFHNKILESWIFDNYTLSSAKINDFSLTIPLKSDNILTESLNSLYVSGEVKNANVTFKENLPPIFSPNVKMIFAKNALEFYPDTPNYQNHILSGSQVSIKNIFTNPSLEIFINTNSPLDDEIETLLESYHITLPIQAPNAKIETKLHLKVDLQNHSIDYKGIFKSHNADIMVNSIPFYSEYISVNMDNHLINVNTKNSSYKNYLKGDSNFILDTTSKTLSGDLLIHSFLISSDSTEILSIQNHLLPFKVNFQEHNQTLIEFPTLQLLSTLKDDYYFEFNDLNALLPFSQLLKEYKIQQGYAKITTKDFNEFYGNLSVQSTQNILLDKSNNQPLNSFELQLHYNPTYFSIQSQDENFIFRQNEQSKQLTLNNLGILIDLEQLKTSSKQNTPFIIQGKNSNLHTKKYTILSDSFSLSLINDELKATLTHKNGRADIYKKGDSITIDAREFGDLFFNTLIGQNAFSNGRFFLNANTNEKGVLIGKINLLNTSINQLNTLQNLMAFIDTIPSLLSLKMPGFNDQGYYLKEGNIVFGLNQDFLAIENLDFIGSSIDIKGKGIIDIKNQNIDFYAQLITAKSLGEIINKIPLVNYILLGKEGTISTSFSIKGPLKDPNITTQTTQDILLSPFNILKRIVTSPLEIFN